MGKYRPPSIVYQIFYKKEAIFIFFLLLYVVAVCSVIFLLTLDTKILGNNNYFTLQH